MQVLNQKLTDRIRTSGAYRNRFFERCTGIDHISPEAVRPYARNWYFVTKHFAVSGLYYNAVLGQCLLTETDPAIRARLQRVLLGTMQIISDDFGLGLGGRGNPARPAGIHYALFASMIQKLGLDGDELDRQGTDELEPETLELIGDIEKKSRHWVSGVASFRVVEAIAYTIVDTMLPLFLAIERNGQRLFTSEELTYIHIHREIERGHDSAAVEMVGEMAGIPDSIDSDNLRIGKSAIIFPLFSTVSIASVMEGEVAFLCERFARFWEAMDRKVFGG